MRIIKLTILFQSYTAITHEMYQFEVSKGTVPVLLSCFNFLHGFHVHNVPGAGLSNFEGNTITVTTIIVQFV